MFITPCQKYLSFFIQFFGPIKKAAEAAFFDMHCVFYSDAISPVFFKRSGIKINSTAFTGSIAMSRYSSFLSILEGVLFDSSHTIRKSFRAL